VTYPDEGAKLARENRLIADFLGGRFARTPSLFEEDEARRLLAERLLCSPLRYDDYIRWRLAALIAPSLHSFRDKRGRLRPTSIWTLVIKPRPRAGRTPRRLPQEQRDRDIAWHIAAWHQIHPEKQMKFVEGEIMRRYGVKRRTVYLAWKKYGPSAKEAYGKVIKSDIQEWLWDSRAQDR
jgi:hypothetical protein